MKLRQILSFFGIQKIGYRPKSHGMELLLGSVKGVDAVLWGYAFSSLIFTGALAAYLPLAISITLAGSAIVASVVALGSKIPISIAGNEERAVAILATIAALLNEGMAEFHSDDSAAATMFTIMALTSLLLGVTFILAARFDLAPLIQLIPFPVVCGFLSGTGWLIISAGVAMTTGHEVEIFHPGHILTGEALIRWMPALACGIGIYLVVEARHHPLTLPLCLMALTAGFFTFAWFRGASLESLRVDGWLFDIPNSANSKSFATLDFGRVNWGFVATVFPQIGTIILISLITAFFSFSALELALGRPIEFNHELKSQGVASLLCATFLSLPGAYLLDYTVMSQNMGGRSRSVALLASSVCLIAALAGGHFVEYIPKVVVAALVFMAAVQLIFEYLLKSCRGMSKSDARSAWLIFGVIVVFGIIPGVVFGIIVTALLFIMRYSKIEIVGSTYSLNQITSSVERAIMERKVLKEYGEHVQVFNLQGFLFFGTANLYFERMKGICEKSPGDTFFIFNFKRVSGIDSTAVQVFRKIINLLDSKAITPVFCSLCEETGKAFEVAGVLADRNCTVLESLDLALKWVEEHLLYEHKSEVGSKSMEEMLEEMLGDRGKADELASTMEKLTLAKGDYLFRQGDQETSAYLIHSGTIEIFLETANGKFIRLREFRHGSVIGEMAAYSVSKMRSASAVAIEPSVLYRLDAVRLSALNASKSEAALHELVARLLSARIGFMNQRIEADI